QAHVQTSDLHFALGVFRDAATYRMMFATLGFSVWREVELDGHRYAIVARDWRDDPPLTWVARTIETLSGVAPLGYRDYEAEATALSRARFDAEVRAALKSATLPHALE